MIAKLLLSFYMRGKGGDKMSGFALIGFIVGLLGVIIANLPDPKGGDIQAAEVGLNPK
ncbi:MAG: hypothetical protein LBU73_04255 [Helicobacteraceae bacterium]|nr:hypothetical protein [Helicobacteraceae bacterium]